MDLNNKAQTFSAVTGQGGTIAMGSGSLTANTSTADDYNGIITGTGSVTKSGSGTLYVGGNNTYSGGDHGERRQTRRHEYQPEGSHRQQRGGRVRPSHHRHLFRDMSGSGSLTKSGTGALTLSGSNTHSGGTTVSGGKPGDHHREPARRSDEQCRIRVVGKTRQAPTRVTSPARER
jgi:autotransporter-associated beta strand protein